MCMYIFLCVHTRAWIHVCTCVHLHAETKGCWISPLILLYLNFLRQGLSIALELKGSTRLSGHQVPGTPSMWVLESKLIGPHGCMSNTFLTEISVQSKYS